MKVMVRTRLRVRLVTVFVVMCPPATHVRIRACLLFLRLLSMTVCQFTVANANSSTEDHMP